MQQPLPDKNLQAQYLVELKSSIKHIPAIQSSSKYDFKPQEIHLDQTTSDIGYLCFFKCPDCPKADLSYIGLRNHCRKKHGSKTLRRHMNNAVELRYHRCLICSKHVACDADIIASHLQQAHQLKVNQYAKTYVLKLGFRVYPTFRDYIKDQNVFKTLEMDNTETEGSDECDNGLILPSMISSESEDSDQE